MVALSITNKKERLYSKQIWLAQRALGAPGEPASDNRWAPDG